MDDEQQSSVPNVYCITQPDNHDISTIIKNILQQDTNVNDDTEVIILTNISSEVNDVCHDVKLFTVTNFMVALYRKHKVGRNERETVIGQEDFLIAIQLILADLHKQEHGDFDVDTSDVLQIARHVMNQRIDADLNIDSEQTQKVADGYKDFLVKCNAIDMCDVYHKMKDYLEKDENRSNIFQKQRKYVIIGQPSDKIQFKFLSTLFSNHPINVVSIETPLEESDDKPTDIKLSMEKMTWNDMNSDLSLHIQSSSQKRSVTEIHIRRTIFAYLSLLVNTRNEIALTRCLNTPDRELDHLAFTTLKRLARNKNMPMCQTAVSFVMKVRLGGCHSVGSEESPLAPYVKGLSEFVNMIQKMQTIIEEDPNTRSGMTRILQVIKKTICKSNDVRLRRSSLDIVFEQLHKEVSLLCGDRITCLRIGESPRLSVANGGSMAGRQIIKTLQSLLDNEASKDVSVTSVDVLTDNYSSQKTPIRFPSLLSQFRSPDVECPTEPENQSLRERVLQNMSAKKKHTPMKYKSCMAWADGDQLKEDELFRSPYEECLSPVNQPCTPVNHAVTPVNHSVIPVNHDIPANHDASPVSHNKAPVNQDAKAVDRTENDSHERRKELRKRILEEIGDDEISDCEEKDTYKPKEHQRKKQRKNKEPKVGVKENSPSKKPVKKSTGRTKKKLIPLQKGQKQLTAFFGK